MSKRKMIVVKKDESGSVTTRSTMEGSNKDYEMEVKNYNSNNNGGSNYQQEKRVDSDYHMPGGSRPGSSGMNMNRSGSIEDNDSQEKEAAAALLLSAGGARNISNWGNNNTDNNSTSSGSYIITETTTRLNTSNAQDHPHPRAHTLLSQTTPLRSESHESTNHISQTTPNQHRPSPNDDNTSPLNESDENFITIKGHRRKVSRDGISNVSHTDSNGNAVCYVSPVSSSSVATGVEPGVDLSSPSIDDGMLVSQSSSQQQQSNSFHFPSQLHDVLSKSELAGTALEWLPHGRSWRVLRWDSLRRDVLSKHFPQFGNGGSDSFLWHVTAWGFKEIKRGPDRGSYFHTLFLQGRRGLSHQMPWPVSYVVQPKTAPEDNQHSHQEEDIEDDTEYYYMSKQLPLPTLPNVDMERSHSTMNTQFYDSNKANCSPNSNFTVTNMPVENQSPRAVHSSQPNLPRRQSSQGSHANGNEYNNYSPVHSDNFNDDRYQSDRSSHSHNHHSKGATNHWLHLKHPQALGNTPPFTNQWPQSSQVFRSSSNNIVDQSPPKIKRLNDNSFLQEQHQQQRYIPSSPEANHDYISYDQSRKRPHPHDATYPNQRHSHMPLTPPTDEHEYQAPTRRYGDKIVTMFPPPTQSAPAPAPQHTTSLRSTRGGASSAIHRQSRTNNNATTTMTTTTTITSSSSQPHSNRRTVSQRGRGPSVNSFSSRNNNNRSDGEKGTVTPDHQHRQQPFGRGDGGFTVAVAVSKKSRKCKGGMGENSMI